MNPTEPLRISRSLPSSFSQPQVAADINSGARKFTEIHFDVPANQDYPLDVPGNYVFVRASSQILGAADGVSSSILVTCRDSNGNLAILDQIGRGFEFPADFAGLVIRSTQAVTISLYIGFGRVLNDSTVKPVVGLGDTAVFEFTRPANVTPYAANQYVSDGVTPMTFLRLARFPFGTGLITHARLSKNSITTANADFSLFLFQGAGLGAVADQAAFALTFNFPVSLKTGQGVIRFNSFLTGGAGSDMAICDLAGLRSPFKTDGTQTASPGNGYIGGGGMLGAVLVANAAYVPGLSESFRLELFSEKF